MSAGRLIRRMNEASSGVPYAVLQSHFKLAHSHSSEFLIRQIGRSKISGGIDK